MSVEKFRQVWTEDGRGEYQSKKSFELPMNDCFPGDAEDSNRVAVHVLGRSPAGHRLFCQKEVNKKPSQGRFQTGSLGRPWGIRVGNLSERLPDELTLNGPDIERRPEVCTRSVH